MHWHFCIAGFSITRSKRYITYRQNQETHCQVIAWVLRSLAKLSSTFQSLCVSRNQLGKFEHWLSGSIKRLLLSLRWNNGFRIMLLRRVLYLWQRLRRYLGMKWQDIWDKLWDHLGCRTGEWTGGKMNKMDHELGIVEFMILFYFVWIFPQ